MIHVLQYVLFCGLATAAASAIHGGNYTKKLYVMAGHAFLCPLVALIFWPVFRRGRQAKAELDLIDGAGGYDAVVRAYYIKPLGKLMARVMRYVAENRWIHTAPDSNGYRTQQELCGGFVLGVVLSLLTLPLTLALGL